MSPVSGGAPGPAGHAADNDYDSVAEAYSAVNEVSLLNAYYERPATLAGDVAGRRVLDAGCGSGPLFAALRDRGAIVTGFDKSAGMLELARRRLKPRQRRRLMSYPLAIRLMIAMTLMPDACYAEAMSRLAGLLADIPFALDWHIPTGKVVTEWRLLIPAPVAADEESFTAARHHMIRSMATSQVTTSSSLEALAASAGSAGRAILRTLNVPGRERHSERAQKARPKFPHATATKQTVTGKPQVTVFAPGFS